MSVKRFFVSLLTLATVLAASAPTRADDDKQTGSDSERVAALNAACTGLPSNATLRQALRDAGTEPGGLRLSGAANDMWATVVNRDGIVCAVAFSGQSRTDQWPGSRVISAQKANTANAFSLPAFALASANLYAAVQPGGSLFGLQESNPVATRTAYAGEPAGYGTADDPMIGKRIGGVNIFGGGLALYRANGQLIGGIGVSGDTSCRDHRVAWVARAILKLDTVPAGVNTADPGRPDNIVFDIAQGNASVPQATEGGRFLSVGGFGHPICSIDEPAFAAALPVVSRKTAVAQR